MQFSGFERYTLASVALSENAYDLAIKAFSAAGDYSDAVDQTKESKYQKGISLFEAADYDGATEVFQAINGYNDADVQARESQYRKGITLLEAADYDGAAEVFTTISDYSDAATQVQESKYQKAEALYASGDYDKAYLVFVKLTGYKDVDSRLKKDKKLKAAAAAREAMFAVGKTMTFGTYPQTAAGSDKTPIEWIVLARDGQKALLLSKYGLDAKPYNTDYVAITWEKCSLRKWLNSDFLDKAFSSDEQAGILLTNVDNSKSQGYSNWSTNGGNDTQDKVFLLSYNEAWTYFRNDKARKCAPTDYAVKQGAYTSDSNKVDGRATGWWCLRSPGRSRHTAAYVYDDGSLHSGSVRTGSDCVRPAFWINLDSGIF